jgi:GT2 family glycosyltransferase
MKKISVVIVNWNSGYQLKRCCDSILEFGCEYVDKIIIFDNGSTDNSLDVFEGVGKVEIYLNDHNMGFGMACNLGAAKIDSEYILFINPDTEVYEKTLGDVLGFMNDPMNKNIGISGVKLLNDYGRVARSCARFPNSLRFLANSLGVDRIFPKMGFFMSEWPHLETKEVDHVIGAFYMIRRHIFEKLSGFDERFFLYYEDLDLSYRAQQAGWRIIYLANIQAFHAGGGTSNQVKARRLFYSLRSRLLYAFKHFNFVGAILVLLSTLFIEPISRSALAIARRSWTSLKETWQGYGMLWQWLPQWWFKGITR